MKVSPKPRALNSLGAGALALRSLPATSSRTVRRPGQERLCQGDLDAAGTRGVFWQYFNVHGNEPYEVLGFLKAMRET